MKKSLICLLFLTQLFSVAFAAELRIGFAIAQTGGLAPFDAPVIEGSDMAIEEINAAGGIMKKIKIKAIIRDVRSEASQTAIAAQELVNEKINILVTPCDADPSFAVIDIINKEKIPAISTCATAPSLTMLGGEYMFLNSFGDQHQAAATAQYARDNNFKTAYILYSPDAQYTMLPLYFEKSFKKLGGKIVGKATYKMDQQDFSAFVTKLKAMKPQPDVIMTAAFEPSFPALIRSLRAMGITSKVIGSDGIDSPTVINLGKSVDGVVFSTHGFASKGSSMEKFEKAYAKKYGRPSETVFNAMGYDLIKVIEAAVVKSKGKLDGKSLQKALTELRNVQGATGMIDYDNIDRIPQKNVFIVEIRSGKKKLIKSFIPDASIVAEPMMGN